MVVLCEIATKIRSIRGGQCARRTTYSVSLAPAPVNSPLRARVLRTIQSYPLISSGPIRQATDLRVKILSTRRDTLHQYTPCVICFCRILSYFSCSARKAESSVIYLVVVRSGIQTIPVRSDATRGTSVCPPAPCTEQKVCTRISTSRSVSVNICIPIGTTKVRASNSIRVSHT